ncbi:MAG: zinc-binding dehydrogenase [Firmicutes bacterium]|nr:zinc-binding dehydrogenase [Bacillota bacterium]
MEKYKVSVITDENKVKYYELDKKEPVDNEVLVKVHSSAICTLEQRVFKGIKPIYPFAGGHEVSGIVEKIGSKVKSVSKGDKVVIRTLNTCGECEFCRSGHENLCRVSYQSSTHSEFKGPGGLSEYMTVDAAKVYKLDQDVNLSFASLTEPLACCIHSIKKANIDFGDNVVVMGVGIMGLFHIQLAKLRGAKVIACDINEERLEIASNLGADITINSSDNKLLIKKINEITKGRGVDVSICTVPSTLVAADCVSITGKLGRVVMYTSFYPDNPIDTSPNKIHSTEKTITGAVSPTNKDFLIATKLISNNVIDMENVITDIIPMTNLKKAFEKALKPSSYRILIDFS